MPTIQHSALTGANLHEPKGITAAAVDKIYMANGSGSGDWEFPEYTLNVHIPNISSANSMWVVAPWAGTIQKMYSVIQNAITVANNTISLEIAGVAVTNSALTVAQAGSAAGDVDSSTPTALNAVAAGQAIEVIYGGSTTACVATITLVIKRTA